MPLASLAGRRDTPCASAPFSSYPEWCWFVWMRGNAQINAWLPSPQKPPFSIHVHAPLSLPPIRQPFPNASPPVCLREAELRVCTLSYGTFVYYPSLCTCQTHDTTSSTSRYVGVVRDVGVFAFTL